ncbi:MAG: hypothetical protein AAF304_09965 [Pseudomonadota bacterium]
MSQIILNSDESQILGRVLSHLVLKARTGEIGIFHGMDRFVSTQDCLKKKDVENLESALAKIGINLKTE